MSRVNPRLVYWISSLYDYADLTRTHRDILTYLATKRLDYGTGTGSCSVDSLAGSTGCHEKTVRNALKLATKLGLIERTQRGHRLGDGTTVPSRWRIIYPPMSTGQGCDVETTSTGPQVPLEVNLNRAADDSQPGRRSPHTEGPLQVPPTVFQLDQDQKKKTGAAPDRCKHPPVHETAEGGLTGPGPGAHLATEDFSEEDNQYPAGMTEAGRRAYDHLATVTEIHPEPPGLFWFDAEHDDPASEWAGVIVGEHHEDTTGTYYESRCSA